MKKMDSRTQEAHQISASSRDGLVLARVLYFAIECCRPPSHYSYNDIFVVYYLLAITWGILLGHHYRVQYLANTLVVYYLAIRC